MFFSLTGPGLGQQCMKQEMRTCLFQENGIVKGDISEEKHIIEDDHEVDVIPKEADDVIADVDGIMVKTVEDIVDNVCVAEVRIIIRFRLWGIILLLRSSYLLS